MISDAPMIAKDRWIARALSLGLHALLFVVVGRSLQKVSAPTMVIFSVETVSGLTPRGEGSGAEGNAPKISNVPANANPLAGGLHLDVTDAPVPAPTKSRPAPAAKSKPVAASPTLKDLDKRYEALNIGLKPRNSQAAQEPSEGGMGNAHQAGTPGGVLGLEGAIAGRGYRTGDYSYGRPLPGESEVLIQIVVNAAGEVLSASIKRTSGYHELDDHALSKAREISFDPLPSGVPQENQTGTALYKFEYNGHSRL